jgi:hypothetical protein
MLERTVVAAAVLRSTQACVHNYITLLKQRAHGSTGDLRKHERAASNDLLAA